MNLSAQGPSSEALPDTDCGIQRFRLQSGRDFRFGRMQHVERNHSQGATSVPVLYVRVKHWGQVQTEAPSPPRAVQFRSIAGTAPGHGYSAAWSPEFMRRIEV